MESPYLFSRRGGGGGDPEDLSTDHAAFANYAGVDDDEGAATEIQRLESSGFVASFSDLASVTQSLGEKPYLSKLGVIKKLKQ